MSKSLNFSWIISWVASIMIALLGGYIVWFLLEFPYGYNYIERALVGMIIFMLISIARSSYGDFQKISNPSPQLSGLAHVSTKSMPSYSWQEIISSGLRITLAIYFCVYWFNQGGEWVSRSESIQSPNLFLTLLVLGTFTMINMTVTVYLIGFEPWQSFMTRNVRQNNSKQTVFYLFGMRIFSFVILSLLWYWFFTPGLEAKILSTLSFVVIVLLTSGVNVYYRRR